MERVLLGYCGVDSGQILLIDPCYVEKGINYEGLCAQHGNDFGCPVAPGTDCPGGDGVVTSTGFGDGCYPVYAVIKDFGEWGKRVASVTIEFTDEEEEP